MHKADDVLDRLALDRDDMPLKGAEIGEPLKDIRRVDANGADLSRPGAFDGESLVGAQYDVVDGSAGARRRRAIDVQEPGADDFRR